MKTQVNNYRYRKIASEKLNLNMWNFFSVKRFSDTYNSLLEPPFSLEINLVSLCGGENVQLKFEVCRESRSVYFPLSKTTYVAILKYTLLAFVSLEPLIGEKSFCILSSREKAHFWDLFRFQDCEARGSYWKVRKTIKKLSPFFLGKCHISKLADHTTSILGLN